MNLLKQVLLIGALCFGFTNMNAENSVNSSIEKVTVYLSQAKVERTAIVNLKPGMNEIVLSDLSPILLPNSIQAKVLGGVLLSVSNRQNFNDKLEVSEEIQFYQDSVKTVRNNLDFLRNEIEVNKLQQKLIENNNPLPSNTEEGFEVSDLQNLVKYYQDKMLGLKNDLVLLKRKEAKGNSSVQRYQNQIYELTGKKTKNTREVVLKISSAKAQTTTVNFKYLVASAGWRPSYNMNASGNNEYIKLTYIGHVFQNTGINWEGVDLVLSSSNPSTNQSRPILTPWYVSIYQPEVQNTQGYYKMEAPSISNMAYNKEAKSLSLEEIVVEDDSKFGREPITAVTNMSELAVEYAIPFKADIKSDNKENDIWIKDQSVPATYQFHAVPKLSSSGYLLAKVANWDDYNLLLGTANLFYDDMYIGKTTINPRVQSDTLLLSMGRDDRIVLAHSKVAEGCSSKIFGKLRKQTFEYEIKVSNNKSKSIDIEVLDNIPVSSYESIKVELDNDGGAKLVKSSGKLTWNLKLKPNETKTLRYSFIVSYPKDIRLSGL